MQTDYSADELEMMYPFASLVFGESALLALHKREAINRSLRRLYPRLAQIIAQERYSDVHLERLFVGDIDVSAANTIDRIVTDLRSKLRKPNHAQEVAEIVKARRGRPRQVLVRADLFIGDFAGGPFFAEIKTPVPNLDIAAESKQKILTFIALHHDQNPQAFLAFPYNPFLTRQDYKHRFTAQIMDLEAEVLMGEEFWDRIGGTGTYAELLDVMEEVKERTPLGHKEEKREC